MEDGSTERLFGRGCITPYHNGIEALLSCGRFLMARVSSCADQRPNTTDSSICLVGESSYVKRSKHGLRASKPVRWQG